MTAELTDRLRREIEHGSKDIALRQAGAGWDSPAGRVRRDRRATFLLNQIPRSRWILETGAGTGMHTLGLVAAIDDVTAIDISPDLPKVAKRRAPRAKYRLMDGHAPEFSPGTFDAILGVSILHHLNWDIALANYVRLLSPHHPTEHTPPGLFCQDFIHWLTLGDECRL